MTIRLTEDGVIHLAGACPIEEAEPLLRLLAGHPAAAVDWRMCEQAHSAVIQLLLATKRELIGPPADGFLAKHIAGQLDRGGMETDAIADAAPLPNRQP